jgi:flagellin
MQIKNNLAGLNVLRRLNKQNKRLAKTTSKLSSGLRIASSADDAAGLSISEKMRGQIRGLQMASRNARDAQSYIQSKEGTLDEVHEMLHRMRELSIQSMNDTLTAEDRLQIQEEFRALQVAIGEMTMQSEFNAKPMFDAHQAAFYQLNGNQQFDSHIQIIEGFNNDLIISVDNKIVQITIEDGLYPPRELADLIDTKLMAAHPDLVINYTEQGYFTLQAEGSQAVDYIKGGLSFLFHEYVLGNPPGMIIGVTEFQENGRLLIHKGHNDRLTFNVGSSKEYTIVFPVKEEGYSMDELIGIINQQLEEEGETDVQAIRVSDKHIALTSNKHVITGLKGNMIKIDGITSVLYDNAKYGSVSKGRAYIRSSKDLSAGIEIIKDENDTLKFYLNKSTQPVEIKLLDPAEDSRHYTLSELVAKLNSEFEKQELQVYASGTSSTLGLYSTYYGKDSRVELLPSVQAFEDLFVRVYEDVKVPTTSTGSITKAAVQGRYVLGDTIEITADVNDEIKLNIDGESVTITLQAGTLTREELVDQINTQLEGYEATASIEGGSYGQLVIQHNQEDTNKISLDPSSNSYQSLFCEPYNISPTITKGTTVWPEEGIVGEPLLETPAILTGSVSLSDDVEISASNDKLSFVLSNQGISIELEHGTFTAVQLKEMLAEKLDHHGVDVSLNSNNRLVFTTQALGASQSFTNIKGSAYTTLLADTGYYKPYEQLADKTYSSITGRKSIKDGIIIDETNNSFSFTYWEDDKDYKIDVKLPESTYANSTDVEHALQDAINTALKGIELEEDSLIVTLSGGCIKIRAANPGSSYKLDAFSGSFYDSFFFQRDEVRLVPTPASGFANSDRHQLAYIVGRENLIDDVVIDPYVNDILIFDFQIGTTKETFELTLSPGKYSPEELVAEIQGKIDQQLAAKGLESYPITVQIGGVDSGTAVDDTNKLVIKHVPPDDGTNNNGTYIIDGVRGTAAYTVFYKSQGEPRPTHTVGSLDLRSGASIITGVNDTFTMDINGEEKSIVLEAGNYPPEELLQAINVLLDKEELGIVASYFEGRLKLSFKEPGMQTIDAIRGNAKDTLFFEVNSRAVHESEHFQVGANSGQALTADHSRISTELLRINTVMIHKAEAANKALTRLDNAISFVSSERGRMGALHNRLDDIIQNNDHYRENLTAAESRIRDADMAQEIMEHVKTSLLQQSAIAMLTHAQVNPQAVLQLLS